MTIPWEQTYIGRLRQQVGNQKLIIPSIRAIIQDEEGKILFINRRGENSWGMPAGSIELEESITDCLRREVKEETGLNVESATLIAIYTDPCLATVNRFGDAYQLFEFVFRVDQWSGRMVGETDESTGIGFYPIDSLPNASNEFWHKHHLEVCQDLINFQGQVILK